MSYSDIEKKKFNATYRRWNIVVVEPDSHILDKLEEVMEEDKFVFHGVATVAEVKSLLKKQDPDLMVIDFEHALTDDDVDTMKDLLHTFRDFLLLLVCKCGEAEAKLEKAGVTYIMRPPLDLARLRGRINSIIYDIESS